METRLDNGKPQALAGRENGLLEHTGDRNDKAQPLYSTRNVYSSRGAMALKTNLCDISSETQTLRPVVIIVTPLRCVISKLARMMKQNNGLT